MVDTAITGMFGRNTKTASLSETKKTDAQMQAAFADIMTKSMNFLPVSNNIKGTNQVMNGSKTSIDSVFVKNDIKANSNKNSTSLNADGAAKVDDVSQNSKTKEVSQGKEKAEVALCDNEEDIEKEETVKNMMSQFIETVKKILGISDEEFQKAMSELGLTSADLLEPGNVANFIAQLSGKQDAISVITDADLSLKLKDIIQSAADMMSKAKSQYGISEEQFKNVAQMYTDDVTTGNQVLSDKMENLQDGVKQSAIQEEAQVKSEEYVSDNSSLEQVISEKVTVSSLENKNSNEFAGNSNDSKQGMSENSKNNAGINSDMTSGATIAAQLAETFETAFANNLEDVKPVDIVRQVVTSIKLNLTSQLKSMEIALNPENLGKVNLLVSVREGVVTAKLVAENEQVKKALEGQLNVLKENMSNQGLKVEAVEVTVQNNAFQNQENFNGNNQQQQANGTKKHFSHLSLSDDEEVTEMGEETTSISENSSVEFSA